MPREFLFQGVLHGLEIAPGIEPSRNARLIAHGDNRNAEGVDVGNGGCGSLNQLDVLGARQIANFLDDYAIPIEKQRRRASHR